MTKEKQEEEFMQKEIAHIRERELEFFNQYVKSPWRLIALNFLIGTARGLGFFIGAALIISAGGYVLHSYLGQIPLIGQFLEIAGEWIESNQPVNLP
jgi:hypothetical protein